MLDPGKGSHYCLHPFGSNHFNSSCHFRCELGFQLVGTSHLRCQASGHWDHPVPLCQGRTAGYLQGNRSKQWWMGCSQPFALYCFLLPIVVEQCPALNHANISAGRVNCSHPIAPYSYNSTCEVRCDEGYKLSGPDLLQCDHTGQWTARIPACTSKVIITLSCKKKRNV